MRTAASISSVVLGVLLLLCAGAAAAQSGSGRPVDGFVWSETTGWVVMAPAGLAAQQRAVVFDDHLAGFAWSKSFGWIKLGSEGGGPYTNSSASSWSVNRVPDGSLSGSAWSEAAGWIRFDPSFEGVRLDPRTGLFDGYAWSETIGWIHIRGFDPDYGPSIELSVLEIPTLGSLSLILLALLLMGCA